MYWLRYIFFFICLGLANVRAFEETKKYETYLNGIKTLSGQFTQLNSNGQMATGTIRISRPGKIRLEYDPPSHLLIISNGEWLINYDKEDGESTYVSLDSTPAAFILRPHVRFHGDVEVTNIIPKDNITEISLVRTDEPEAGLITLVFEDNPLALKEWRIVDAQGIETRVMLSKIKSNIKLQNEIFTIKDPNILQRIF